MAGTELISLGNLPTLPSTASTALVAGWLSMLTAGETFTILNDTGSAGIIIQAASVIAGQTEWTISARDSGGVNIFSADVITIPSFRTGWHSYAISVDTATHTLQLLVDLTLFAPSVAGVTWNSSNAIAFFPGTDEWVIGPVDGPGYGVDISNFRFGAGEAFFDLANAANVAKLFGAGGAPIYWGPDGSFVTGVQPAVDLSGNSANFGDNLGSGGTFDVSGPALTDVAGPSGTVTTTVSSNAWFQSVSVGGKFLDMAADEWDGNFELFNVKMPVPVSFEANFGGSPLPDCQVAPGADVELTFQIISGDIVETLGTLTIPSGTKTGSFSTTFTPGGFTVWPGQNLRLYAPSNVDAAIIGFSGTIVGTR